MLVSSTADWVSPSESMSGLVLSLDTEETECKAFSPVVRIGSAHSLTRSRVLHPPPPIWFWRGAYSLAGEEVRGPKSDEGTDTFVL